MLSCKGPDVYHADGVIDWKKVLVEGGCSFGWAKISEHVEDPQFHANWTGMAAAGITRGGFHFYHPGPNNNADQVKLIGHTLVEAGGFTTHDLLAIDVEVNDGLDRTTCIARTKDFVDRMTAIYGKRLIFYTYSAFPAEYLDSSFGGTDLWIADYTTAAAPRLPSGWTTWKFWQYAGTGDGEHPGGLHPVPGCPGATLDISRYNGSHDDLVAHYGLH